jgi:hypothetical protein
MQINHRVWTAILAFAMLTAASCGSNAPTPASATPPMAKSPTPPPAKTVDTAVNSKGLREGREVEYVKPKGRMRIVCVGGSVTFGEGVARDATYEAWMQKNMRGRAYDVEVLNAGKAGRTLAESAALLGGELLKYEPSLVVVSMQDGEGAKAVAELQKIEAMLKAKGIVYILLAVPDYVAAPGYTPKPPAVYVVPSKAALNVFADKDALLDDKGRWTEFAHMKMGNALAELIVGAPLICCATGPVPENP